MTKWTKRWAEGQTGWHRDTINDYLQQFYQVLFQNPNPRVLVPLCGRSLDVAWLASHGAEVIGVDLVEQPLVELFAQCELQPQSADLGGLPSMQAGGIQLIHADIFAVTTGVIEPVDAIYDRAALVALPLPLRQRYVKHCLSLLRPGGRLLLLTYDSPAGEDSGPPYPVRPGVVEKLFSAMSECSCLHSVETLSADDERLQRRNLAWSRTDIWQIVK